MDNKIAVDRRSLSLEGFLLADAILATPGPLPYLKEELNLPGNPEEIFYLNKTTSVLKDALHSFMGAPITKEHPDAMLDSDNARFYAIGSVVTEPRIDAKGNVRATVRIYDRDTVNKIRSGEDELSPGFTYELGNTSEKGGDISKMHVNHVAVVQKGRAGPPVKVLDHLPTKIEVLQMEDATDNSQSKPVDMSAFADAMKQAFDSALEQKATPGADLEKVKNEIFDHFSEKMKPVMDTMIGFNQAQEKAAAEAQAAADAQAQKTAIDSAVNDAVMQERKKYALALEAATVNSELAVNELIEMAPRDILTRAIGDSFPVNDSMSDDMLHGLLKGIVATKASAPAQATDAGGSVMPPPPAFPSLAAQEAFFSTNKNTVNVEKYQKRFAASMPGGK